MRHLLPFRFPGIPNIHCVFTTAATGNISMNPSVLDRSRTAVADTATLRQQILATLDIPAWTELNQVHGDEFLVDPDATMPETASTLDADGHCTQKQHHALCIKTADCQPILLAHPKGYIAALHVGWRGNVLKFPITGVYKFCKAYGLEAKDIRAVRGPSLGYAEFVNFSREWPLEFAPWFSPATKRVDLWGLTHHQLTQAGLLPRNIYSIDLCTHSVPDMFYSHRRGHPERQAALIWAQNI